MFFILPHKSFFKKDELMPLKIKFPILLLLITGFSICYVEIKEFEKKQKMLDNARKQRIELARHKTKYHKQMEWLKTKNREKDQKLKRKRLEHSIMVPGVDYEIPFVNTLPLSESIFNMTIIPSKR